MDQFYKEHVAAVVLQQQQQPLEAPTSPPSLLEALRRIPKTDLHCHLNGSITPALLAHMERLLLQEHRRTHASGGADKAAENMASPTAAEAEAGHILFFNSQEKRMRNVLASPASHDAAAAPAGASASHSSPKDRMNYCFTVFDAIYKIMTNLAFTRLAVQDMLLCSAAENIMAMEIRTSLRDGLRRSFRHAAAAAVVMAEGANEPVSTAVSKEMYVDTVIETVEHVLAGGLVDLESGELLSTEATAHILANPQCVIDEEREKKAAVEGEEAVAVRWWRVYDRVYGSLFTAAAPPPPPRESPDVPSHRRFFVETAHANLVCRMHVRLLLSINRAATEEAAWEAARLTTRTQQRQVQQFHTWCCAAVTTTPEHVWRKLRQTCWVTGVDLSGNCYRGLYTTFSAALAAARRGTVPAEGCGASTVQTMPTTAAAVTLHGGEKQDAAELHAMVAFFPDRWGHLVFTDDDNLSTILAAQQGIELCLTSNLLTSGHASVAEHHLGHLLELWDRMPQSRHANVHEEDELSAAASPSAQCVAATEAARLAARRRSVERRFGTASADALPSTVVFSEKELVAEDANGASRAYVLPSISFHTDDRGVFGTTLSDELVLASQHPSVQRLCHRMTGAEDVTSVAALAEFFWLLTRLSLTQVFCLPLPVQLLAVCLTEGKFMAAEAHEGAASRMLRCGSATEPAAWRDWPTFVQVCEDVSTTQAGGQLASQLSRWEYTWLSHELDHYYV